MWPAVTWSRAAVVEGTGCHQTTPVAGWELAIECLHMPATGLRAFCDVCFSPLTTLCSGYC